jgi:uncharacterized protein YlaN (UPF0358 family)
MIERTMKQNAEHVKKLLFAALPEITYDSCPCREAVKSSVL